MTVAGGTMWISSNSGKSRGVPSLTSAWTPAVLKVSELYKVAQLVGKPDGTVEKAKVKRRDSQMIAQGVNFIVDP